MLKTKASRMIGAGGCGESWAAGRANFGVRRLAAALVGGSLLPPPIGAGSTGAGRGSKLPRTKREQAPALQISLVRSPNSIRNPATSVSWRSAILWALLALFLIATPAFAQTETRPNLARQRSDATVQAKGSRGWWLGTAAALVVLAGAGALCLAARGKTANGAAARLRVLGRVHLPPKHTLFLVKAGRRTLLIGAGPQGAPSLLGELDDDDDETEPPAESITARLDAAATAHHHHRAPRAPARFDVELGDES